MKYLASMKHNADTIYRLSQTQYCVFGGPTRAILLLLSGIWLYLGIQGDFAGGVKLVCLMLGCFFITGINVPPRWNAEKYLKQIDGIVLETNYEFRIGTFLYKPASDNSVIEIPYQKIIRLVEDDLFFYLFINKHGAYMVEKDSLSPKDIEGFKNSLQKLCNQPWKKVKVKRGWTPTDTPPQNTLWDRKKFPRQ